MSPLRIRNRIRTNLMLCLTLAAWPLVTQAQQPATQTEALDQILASAGFTGVLLLENPGSNTVIQGSYQNANDSLPTLHPDSEAIPASTFKIFSSMVALQEGVVQSATTIIPWDGVERSRPEINQDLSLTDAFRYSAVPHYQGMIQTIGESRMQYWLDQAEYGNQNLSGGLTTFWLEGALRITPREQLKLLQALHQESLPFDPEVQQTLKDIMINREESGVVIRGKTGLAVFDNGLNTGWWVGWAENGHERWYFAALLQASADFLAQSENGQAQLIASRQTIVDQALRYLEILPPSP